MLLMKPWYNAKCCISRDGTIYTGYHVAKLQATGCLAARGGVIPAMEYSESCAILLLCPLPPPQGPLHVLLEGVVDHEQLLAGFVDHVQLLQGVVDHEQDSC